jgi:transposase
MHKESEMAKRKKTRRKFSAEFKAEVVKLVLDGGHSVPDVCREHELHESSIYLWVKQAQVDRGKGPAGALTTPEKAELAQLRRENRELRRERDFFEQATAYFAKGKR